MISWKRERDKGRGDDLGSIVCFLVRSWGTKIEQLCTKESKNLGFSGFALCFDCKTLVGWANDQESESECLDCIAHKTLMITWLKLFIFREVL